MMNKQMAGASREHTGRPRVAITMGDPAGVGPEIVAKALSHPEVFSRIDPVVVGDRKRLELAVELTRTATKIRTVRHPGQYVPRPGVIDCIDLDMVPEDLPFGELSALAGEAAYRYVERAACLAMSREIDALCTAPLNKEALHAAGRKFPGHTELLASLTDTPEVSMLLTAPGLRVIHVTTHMGLLDAIEKIDAPLVERTILRGARLLQSSGLARPRVAVCGINPHAGENGLFGRGEEALKIRPAIEQCRTIGLQVEGPLPADTLFFRAVRGDFDLVVAMYHDQGHSPVKVMGLETGVNVTVGLPFVRTSVDHGTAFDIAGTGVADERSLLEALEQAAQFCPAATPGRANADYSVH